MYFRLYVIFYFVCGPILLSSAQKLLYLVRSLESISISKTQGRERFQTVCTYTPVVK